MYQLSASNSWLIAPEEWGLKGGLNALGQKAQTSFENRP